MFNLYSWDLSSSELGDSSSAEPLFVNGMEKAVMIRMPSVEGRYRQYNVFSLREV